MQSAFVLSAYPAGLGVIRALAAHGVPLTAGFYDPQEIGRASRYIRRLVRLPNAETQESAYVEALLGDRTGNSGDLLIPTADQTLSVVSRNKSVLEQKYRVACPDWSITEKFLDKKYTVGIAEQAGVPAPKTFVPASLEDVERWGRLVQYPCLAKPSQVHVYSRYFPRKMRLVTTFDELVSAFREAQAIGVELMIQEFIPGEDALGSNYNAYYWEGKPLVEFTAQKIRNAPPTMGSPSVLVSAVIPEVVALGRRLLAAANYSGYACTEFKRDPRDGVFKLMEVNARANLSTALAVRCGLNFPWIEYQHRVNGVVPSPKDYETGVYWIDISRDAGFRLVNLGHEGLTLSQFAAPYFRQHIFAVLSLRDPGPAILKATQTARAALEMVFSRIRKPALTGETHPQPPAELPVHRDVS